MEISLTQDRHPQMSVEGNGLVASVYVEFDTRLTTMRFRLHMLERTVEEDSSEALSLTGRQHIYLLKMIHLDTLRIKTFLLYRYITARKSGTREDIVHMPVFELFHDIFWGIHPIHHILHLFRRQDVAVGMSECDFGKVMDDRDIIGTCLSYLHITHGYLISKSVMSNMRVEKALMGPDGREP